MKNDFILWHYTKGLANLFRAWKNFFGFIWYFFGVKIHFFTLFSIWKRDLSQVRRPGFHPLLLLKALTENIFSRFLGSIVRSIVIFLAIILEIANLFIGIIFLIFWISSPLLFILFLCLTFFYFNGPYTKTIFGILAILNLIIPLFSFFCFKRQERDYSKMSFEELSNKKWFQRVWNRIGKEEVRITRSLTSDIRNLEGFLNQLDLTVEEFTQIILWELNSFVRKKKKKMFWLKENLFSVLPIGKDWPFAYTNNIDRYAIDLSEQDPTQYKYSQPIGKMNEIKEAELILSRPSQNSLIIVGEAGTGKKTIVHSLARRIRTNHTVRSLFNKRVLELDLKAIVADSKVDTEKTLHLIFSEAIRAGNVILAISNIQEYLKEDRSEWNFSSILSEYLPYPGFQIIATTTPGEFRSTLEKYENITKNCEKITLKETDFKETLKILLFKLEPIEKERVIFTYQALRKLFNLADQYISDSPFPEKALDLLEEIILYWSQNGNSRYINESIVEKVVSQKIGVPLGEVGDQEGQKLIHLEEILHKRVIGQNFAIESIAATVKKTRLDMTDKKRPLGSFLFLGPTGVGKTETAKALAESYFGNDKRMIRLDMSEYQKADSIDRILGSASTGDKGHLINLVKNNPYSLLLLDEIEKAHPNILDLFLQILDEGSITDAFGKKVNFRNLIIIATSNAGATKIRECMEKNLPSEETQKILTEHLIENSTFKPEFLNRFDGLIYFHPLENQEVAQVIKLLLEKYATRLEESKNIEITFSPEVIPEIAKEAYDEQFGARSVKRYIEDKINGKIAGDILTGKVKKGDKITFGAADMQH